MSEKESSDGDLKSYWLYMRPPDTFGWRLCVNVPLRDVVTATALAKLLLEQFDTQREFAVREDGKKNYRRLQV